MNFLCLEFVNSSWYTTHKSFKDPFLDHEWLLKLADKWDIKSLQTPGETELAALTEMRSNFAKLFTKIVGGQKLVKEDIELVNSYMSNVGFHRQLQAEKEGCKLYEIPEACNWSWFMAEVAASFSKLYSSETVSSLKICQNPECGWFFIDESKSRNRKWCEDTCASLMKVRRFRQKQKENDKLQQT